MRPGFLLLVGLLLASGPVRAQETADSKTATGSTTPATGSKQSSAKRSKKSSVRPEPGPQQTGVEGRTTSAAPHATIRPLAPVPAGPAVPVRPVAPHARAARATTVLSSAAGRAYLDAG
jgi:hypothetical protein